MAEANGSHPSRWMPEASLDELVAGYDRHPIHVHPAIHHLHHRWDMGHALRLEGSGKSPKALLRRLLARLISAALDRYFTEEQEYRAAVAQSVDAVAYRVDEIAASDERAIVEIVRRDLLDLARYVDERIDERLADR
ncbi:MAG TPA: hypothetical protein VNF07_00425 [Acidimicrobiales bacterium]|nr:hypothetical protein [Acidimicrobiales bacterium]